MCEVLHPEVIGVTVGFESVVILASNCGPVPCEIALLLLSVVGAGFFVVLNRFYRPYISEAFPESKRKRRFSLFGVSLLNLLTAASVTVVLYALLP